MLELYGRPAIRASKRISNPGCYATSSQLLIAPLIKHIKRGAWPTVFGVSGYSGAGTVSSIGPDGQAVTTPKVAPESLAGGLRPYALTDHIHEREAGHHLGRLLEEGEGDRPAGGDPGGVRVAFVPAVGPWFSGILSTLSMPLSVSGGSGGITAREVEELFRERYAGERLVRVVSRVPGLADVEGRHGWVVGGFQVHSAGDRVVVVVCSPFFVVFWEGVSMVR
jgi:N-acetyl-gamma-glutamyl-phosphate reductase/acetylglutamate kinase